MFDVMQAERRGTLAEHLVQLGLAGLDRHLRIPRRQPPPLLGQHGLHGHRFIQLIDFGEGRDRAMAADGTRPRVTEHGQGPRVALRRPASVNSRAV